MAKVEGNKIDKYFFSEGFFNFKNKSYIAKETKINIHKDVFGDESNDPRIYGSTSSSDQSKTIVNNAIFTSCKLNDDCPPWSIKAEKITHDKIKKDMIYKNAVIKIYDTPILYFPKFRIWVLILTLVLLMFTTYALIYNDQYNPGYKMSLKTQTLVIVNDEKLMLPIFFRILRIVIIT